MSKSTRTVPTSSHWGNYRVEVSDGKIVAIHSYAVDINPTPIGQSLRDAQDSGCRVPQPMIRKGYFESGWDSDGNGRGREPFVAVGWDTALDIAASGLQRVRSEFGNEFIYAGYGIQSTHSTA